jgi:hypothetical protein
MAEELQKALKDTWTEKEIRDRVANSPLEKDLEKNAGPTS